MFAVVLLLLLVLSGVTAVTQTYVTGGADTVIRSVTENLECLQCHVELIPEFSKTSVHNPFATERCTTCHTPHGEIETTTVIAGIKQAWDRARTLVQWLPVKFVLDFFSDDEEVVVEDGAEVKSVTEEQVKGEESELVMPRDELCWMCHGDMGSKVNVAYPHAPFATGNCLDCHDPHASDFGHMLSMDLDDLCITCHKMGPELARSQLHPPVEGFHCTDCHDPHGSPYKGMLVDNQRDLCFRCHPSVAKLSGMAFQHGPYLNDACTDCHEPHGSNFMPLLRNSQPALCYGCHPAIQTDFLKASHHPVGTISLNCTDCHDAHGTNYAGLLYSEGNDICYDCHALAIKTSYDSSLHAATSCWACHTPHGSAYEPLLVDAQPEVCLACHDAGLYDDRVGGGGANHPVRSSYYDVNAREPLTCTSSCHDPHGSLNLHMLRYFPANQDGNCLICHAVIPGNVVGVDF